MRVLSLFDGIACGRIALERAGIHVEKYYASEIEKASISIAQYNYPNIIQLGDINKIDFSEFIGKVDMIIGGSPCQNLSILGNRKGLQGEQSGLFYKFVEAINTIKPKYFLLENNYGMKQDALEEMSRLMGCYPVLIDSALVSAQRRKRYYWTNIKTRKGLIGWEFSNIPQPKDKNIKLEDVLDDFVGVNKTTEYLDRRLKLVCEKLGYCPLIWNAYDGIELKDKAPTQTTNCSGRFSSSSILRFCEGKDYEVKDGMIYLPKPYKCSLPNGLYGITSQSVNVCEKLQTLPQDYTKFGVDGDTIKEVPKGSRYKAIGNGWTVDVIAHIFSYLEEV